MEVDLRRVVDALPGMVWTALSDGQIDFVNQRWCEYTGLSVEEACGRGWRAAIHSQDLAALLERWRSILVSGQPRDAEARVRRCDGEYQWFLFRACPLVGPSEDRVRWCGIWTDIDDRRRIEDALRTREIHYRSIADSIPALIAFMTPAGEIENVNRHVLDYFGATLEELRSWAIGDAVHPDDLAAVTAAWGRSVDTAEPYDIEHRMRRADGSYRWFHVRALPLRDADGRVARWYCLQTDIDDRKQAEALLAEEKRLLEMVVRGGSMSEILERLCRFVESTATGCYCMVVLVDPSGTRLEYGTAPSLPASFITAILGRPVNADSGPSAMAAYLNEQVVAADFRSETRWAAYEWCPMALAHGLQACWSTPISSTEGKVLGAFALYYEEPRAPTALEQRLIEQFTHIATIAVERSQSDAALRRSEARTTAIVDSALDCIVTIDHRGCITEFNPAAERTFGYRREDVLGEPLADVIIPPLLREDHRRGLARHLATGEARMLGRRVEMTARRADGGEFPVELAIVRIPVDGPPSFTGYLRDITERKRSEEELRHSEAFLAQGQHLSSTGSFSWRKATDEIRWSAQTYRIFEFDQDVPLTLELIGRRVHPDDRPLWWEQVGRARGDGGDLEFELRLQMPNDSIKYLHLVAHGTRAQDGQPEYIGAVQDVTERRRSQDTLGKVRSELAYVARITSLGALTASIAHELSQPLSAIITNASACLRWLAADPPKLDEAIETARRSIRDGRRASEVIVRLRALFGKKATTTEAVNLTEATREVIALMSGELQRARVILRTEFAEGIPLVSGDRVQLQQVILSLLLNASEAMKDVDDRPRELQVRTARDEGDRVCLTVQDAGVGFDVEDLDRLFDAFYTTKSNGMGLGLSVSRTIIESQGGRLWAARNEGPGATFAFSIPCAFAGQP